MASVRTMFYMLCGGVCLFLLSDIITNTKSSKVCSSVRLPFPLKLSSLCTGTPAASQLLTSGSSGSTQL